MSNDTKKKGANMAEEHINKIVITGKLKAPITKDTKEIQIVNRDGTFFVLIPQKYEFLKDKNIKENAFTLCYGFIASTSDKNYIFPYNLMFTYIDQSDANDVYFSGKVVYFYENRANYRLLVDSLRKDKSTRVYVVVFKNEYTLDDSIVGKEVYVYGYLRPIMKNNSPTERVEVIARNIFVPGSNIGAASSEINEAQPKSEVVGFGTIEDVFDF